MVSVSGDTQPPAVLAGELERLEREDAKLQQRQRDVAARKLDLQSNIAQEEGRVAELEEVELVRLRRSIAQRQQQLSDEEAFVLCLEQKLAKLKHRSEHLKLVRDNARGAEVTVRSKRKRTMVRYC